MSKPFQSNSRGKAAPKSNISVMPRKVIVAETSSSKLKKRTGVHYSSADPKQEPTTIANEIEEDDKSVVSSESSQPAQIIRTGRSGVVDIEYSTLVSPGGLRHRSHPDSMSPTCFSPSSFSLPSLISTPAISPSSKVGRSILSVDQTPHEVTAESTLATRLLGLPGHLSMSKDTTSKYFGASAREQFLGRISFLQKHRNNNASIVEDEDIYELHYDSQADQLMSSLPFSVDRNNILQDESGVSEEKDAKSLLSRPSFYSRFKAKVQGGSVDNNDDIMLMQSAFRSGIDDLDSFTLDLFDGYGSGSDCIQGDGYRPGLQPSLVLGGDESLYGESMNELRSFALAPQNLQPFHESAEGDDYSLGDRSQLTDDTLSVLSTLGLRKHLLDNDECATIPASPRSTYINACLREGANPRASLVLRKNLTKRLELQSYGMGDDNARLLATSISSLPFLQSINIADNRLTDDGLYPLIIAMSYIPGLLELNLSQNKVDDKASEALKSYMRRPDCPLERLVLNQADVDDFECEAFIAAVKENRSLIELELSGNSIGAAENLNTVYPDLITGAEALADMIRTESIKLQVLKLDWNMLRLDGAVELCESIGLNHTLTYLDLSYNSLGRAGGVALGQALIRNHTLRVLKLANNSIDARACFSICAGVIENRSLKNVNIDGNPIAEQGAAALMLVPLLAGNRVSISAARCNLTIRDPTCWFSYNAPLGEYSLDLSDGFQRAICLMLLHAIAAHHSYQFEKFDWLPDANSRAAQPISLRQILTDEKTLYFDDEQRRILGTLENVRESASDIQKAVKLFNAVDDDGSGEVERGEFGDLIKSMGIDMSEMRIDEIFAMYDMDQGGSIGITEFLNFLKTQKIEACNRLKDMCFMPLMALEGKSEAYVPPLDGIMKITVVDGFVTKEIKRVLSDQDRQNLVDVADQAGGADASQLIQMGMQSTKIRLEEGLKLMTTMKKDNHDITKILSTLLPQMESNDDAKRLIFQSCANDKNALVKLKRVVGSSLRPIMGAYNGYYRLDLSRVMDRLCLSKLLEVSATQKNHRVRQNIFPGTAMYDISQKRNYSCFRNEHYNRKPITIDDAFASSIQPKGILEFDFSCAIRPTRDDNPLPDFRMVKMLCNSNLLEPQDSLNALQRLILLRKWSNRALECDGHNLYQPDMPSASAQAEAMDEFYSNMQHRDKQFKDAVQRENLVRFDSNGIAIDDCEDDVSNRGHTQWSPLDPKSKEDRLEHSHRYKMHLQRHIKAALKMRGIDDKIASTRSKKRSGKNAVAAISILSSDDDSSAGSHGSDVPTDTESDEEDDGSQVGETDGQDKGQGEDEDVSGLLGSDDDSVSSEEEEGDEVNHIRNFMKRRVAEQQQQVALERSMQQSRPPNVRRAQAMSQEHAVETVGTGTCGSTEQDLVLETAVDKAVEETAASVANRLVSQLLNPRIHIGVKAKRVLEFIDDYFSRVFLWSRQLSLILHCFRGLGQKKATRHFGTYRVEAFIVLVSRVVDLHNIECVFRVLTPYEVACIFCRMGWLSLWNPCKPEGCWELDLTRPEERIVVKCLCELSTKEPGDNWIQQYFKWERKVEGMPGWELTQSWLTDDGLPCRGIISIEYYSGGCKLLRGCRPYVNFRKSLLNLFLLREDEICEEGFRDRPPPASEGVPVMIQDQSRWFTYLSTKYDPSRAR